MDAKNKRDHSGDVVKVKEKCISLHEELTIFAKSNHVASSGQDAIITSHLIVSRNSCVVLSDVGEDIIKGSQGHIID